MKYLAMFGVIGGTGALIWLGIHFGSRWIDWMLCYEPPRDPNKPIVLPMKATFSEVQIHFAARALALANPDDYEDKTRKGSLQPNQKARDAAAMALSAAARHGCVDPVGEGSKQP